jgi:hypothetical protein
MAFLSSGETAGEGRRANVNPDWVIMLASSRSINP